LDTRQKRRRKKARAVFKITAALIFLAAAATVWYTHPIQHSLAGTREFFSDDDGTTWFEDDGTKVAPFDHNGKQAVLAKVFECKTGKPFVGYLMKFSDEARTDIIEAQTTHRAAGGVVSSTGPSIISLLVKKPHDAKWIADSDPKAKVVKTITCPDGSTDVTPVRP
jgi:hypothetical protein